VPFDLAIIPEADTEIRLILLTADFVRYATSQALNMTEKEIKCVVWDLDNTLWDGILLEHPDVKLRPGVLEALRYFDERGILLSVASKNDHEFAWRKLTDLGIADLFLFPQINWMPKSQNIKRVAEMLDIGIDTLAFIDDNPFELEEVSKGNPDVLCIVATDMQKLSSNPRLQGSMTAEARLRRSFYKDTIARQEEERKFGQDYLGFLSSCGISLAIDDYTPDDLDRVSELVQRTNQLNFSGRKYSRAELYDILEDQRLEKYVLKCSDKYGSYGTIGFSIVRHAPGSIRIEDFVVSCRVQGKFLEQAFLGHLMKEHNPYDSSELWVNFRPTARNKPAQIVLETIGFESCAPEVGMKLAAASPLFCDFIKVDCSVSRSAAGSRNKALA
jgi:FkbH-like protein